MKICVALAAFAVACRPGMADPPPDREPPPAKRFERDMMVRLHMHESFDLLRAIERLLIRGQLDDAKRFAAAIAEAPDEPGLGAWTRHAMIVRERAAELARATTVDEACRREAMLAGACASCHDAAGASPEFRAHPPAPPDVSTIDARMVRHRWAADRLWEGIVGGADEPWRAGLEILAATPLDWKTIAPDRARFGRDLQRAADQALRRKAATPADRAVAYGDILTTCAGCHAAQAAPPR
jgi:cytochrome c553